MCIRLNLDVDVFPCYLVSKLLDFLDGILQTVVLGLLVDYKTNLVGHDQYLCFVLNVLLWKTLNI